MSFSLRLAEAQDFSAINQLFTETVHTINAQDYNQEQLNVWAPLNRSFTRWEQAFANNIVYVAEKDHTIIGFADISPTGCINHLYVHKDFQNQGVASALLAALEKVARNLNLPEMYTEASITAEPFFTKKGFIVTKKQSKEKNGLFFINYRMHKKL